MIFFGNIYCRISKFKLILQHKNVFTDSVLVMTILCTGGPLIVPFYVPAKIGCNAKQYYERPTILCHL